MKHWDDCTMEQKIERWENVERVLKALTPHERRKHWDMSQWGIKTDCGTVACAAGHCAMDTWFKRRGLKPFWWIDGVMDLHPEDFFGEDGSNDIFYNSTIRPVSKVIREVRAYIKRLKAS